MRILIEWLSRYSVTAEEAFPLLARQALRPQKNQRVDQVDFPQTLTKMQPLIVPSLLRARLLSLRHAVDYVTRKNAWPVPTGIQMLAHALDRVSQVEETQLSEILVDVKIIIGSRIDLNYLTRDPLTYLFYKRTFYGWLKPLAISAQDGELIPQLVRLNSRWLSRCRATQDALVQLHGFLFEIRQVAQSAIFQRVGSRFIFFGEKPPEGFVRIQHYLQNLPERLSSDQQILLLKQFMQLRRLFTEKFASKNRSFRDSKVNFFYQVHHFMIQTIFNALSKIDQYLLLAINLDDNTPLARDFLPAPLSLLANPDRLIRILAAIKHYQAQHDHYRTDYFTSVENEPICAANLGKVPQSSAANVSLAFAAK